MKRSVAPLLLCLFTGLFAAQARELPRSTFVSYRNANQAFANQYDSSQNFVNLSGAWNFRLFPTAAQIPAEVLAEGYEPAGWRTIAVPGTWELQGEGTPLYADRAYDFLTSKPAAIGAPPAAVPAGVYLRNFTVPFDLADRALFLHIGAAKGGIRVYVNGKEVGRNADSKDAAEFDITLAIQRGRNRLVIVNEKYTSESWLEDQSGWRLSGINREVFVFAQPKIRVRDYLVRTTLDPSYTNGLLETALLLKSQLLNTHTVKVYYELLDPQGRVVSQNMREATVGMRGEDTVRFTASIPGVVKWNAEQPRLYTILYRIQREGRFTEYLACKVGFRTAEVKGNQFLINGKAVSLRGINLAEFDPETGNVLSREQWRERLQQAKYRGVNAVRPAHPMGHDFYELCDELGLYVCDVANLNAQGVADISSAEYEWNGGFSGSPAQLYAGRNFANNPEWLDPFLERVDRMYEQSKNHPSVVLWSLGDHAGNGYNMYRAYLQLRSKESTRPIVYNDADMEWNTDVYCPDQPRRENPSGRPMITMQGVAAAGQGGFQAALEQPLQAATGRELTNDYRPIAKTPPPSVASQEYWKNIEADFQSISVEAFNPDRGTLTLKNNLDFANLSELKCTYELIDAKGKVVKHGVLPASAAPGESCPLTLPRPGANQSLRLTAGNVWQYTLTH